MRLSALALIALFSLMLIGACYSQQREVRLSGVVKDDNGTPLKFVNVYIEGTTTGTTTDENGAYNLAIISEGELEVVFSLLGYEQKKTNLKLDRKQIELDVVLHETSYLQRETMITGTYTGGESKSPTLSSLDIVSMPGTSADIYGAVKTFPGLTFVNESAGLYVRGGDMNETVTYVNGAPIQHPYEFESPYGDNFGLLDPFLVKGITLSTGGFPVEYGNALSGILNLETRDVPVVPVGIATLSLASASAVVGIPIADETLGVRASARTTFTGLLFRVNRATSQFIEKPSVYDGTFSLIYNNKNGLTVKTFSLFSRDKVTTAIEDFSSSGSVSSEGKNQIHTVYVREMPSGNLLLTGNVAYSPFRNLTELDSVSFKTEDNTIYARANMSILGLLAPLNFILDFGGDFTYEPTKYQERLIETGGDNQQTPHPVTLQQTTISKLLGAYINTETSLGQLLWIGGFRLYLGYPSGRKVLDVRMSAGYRLSDDHTVKLSLGTYHQYPGSSVLALDPAAPPSRSLNLIAGYEYRHSETILRIEAYDKLYSDLTSEQVILSYSGFARGVDLIVKGNVTSFLSGWVSYSLLDSKRRKSGTGFYFPSNFDITQSFLVVSEVQFSPLLKLGLNYRYATGRPFTPLASPPAAFNGIYWEPNYSQNTNSDRLPGYSRPDVSLSYLYSFSVNTYLVFFISVYNIFNTPNIASYEYSYDYSQQRSVLQPYGRRFFYFGFSLSQNILQ